MPISDLLSVEEERRPAFVNLDAQFLYDLAVEMDGGEMPDETTVRLRTVARHLESIDAQLQALRTNDAYTAGIIEGKRRYLERSNLPLQSVELTPDLRQAIAKSTVPVKKLPSGKPRPVAKPSPLSLAGIKLDLSGIRKE